MLELRTVMVLVSVVNFGIRRMNKNKSPPSIYSTGDGRCPAIKTKPKTFVVFFNPTCVEKTIK